MIRKSRATRAIFLRVESALYDRLVRMIFHTGKGRTIQRIGESALRRAVEDIESWENEGEPFPEIPPQPEQTVIPAARVVTVKKPGNKE